MTSRHRLNLKTYLNEQVGGTVGGGNHRWHVSGGQSGAAANADPDDGAVADRAGGAGRHPGQVHRRRHHPDGARAQQSGHHSGKIPMPSSQNTKLCISMTNLGSTLAGK